MQGITSKFSMKDFVAYLFPGLTWLLALVVTLMISSEVRGSINCIFSSSSRAAAALFFSIPLAYLLGAIASGIGSSFEECIIKGGNKDAFQKLLKTSDEKQIFKFLRGFYEDTPQSDDINKLLDTVNKDQFYYLARIILGELMPSVTEAAARQDSLRQMRRNSYVPMFFWFVAGLVWGIAGEGQLIHPWHSIVLAASILNFIVVTLVLWTGIRHNNFRRQRDVYLGFICLPTVLKLKNCTDCNKPAKPPDSTSGQQPATAGTPETAPLNNSKQQPPDAAKETESPTPTALSDSDKYVPV